MKFNVSVKSVSWHCNMQSCYYHELIIRQKDTLITIPTTNGERIVVIYFTSRHNSADLKIDETIEYGPTPLLNSKIKIKFKLLSTFNKVRYRIMQIQYFVISLCASFPLNLFLTAAFPIFSRYTFWLYCYTREFLEAVYCVTPHNATKVHRESFI